MAGKAAGIHRLARQPLYNTIRHDRFPISAEELEKFGGVENPLMLPETGRSYDAFDKSFARLGPILETAKVDGYLAAHTNYDDAAFMIEVMRHNPATLPNPFLVGTARVLLFTRMSRECNLNNADLHRAMPNLKAY